MFKTAGKIFFALILLFIAYLFFQASQSTKVDDTQAVANEPIKAPLQRIAFGSCNRESSPQGYWDQIARYQPDQWIWTGDNIYGDSDDPAILAEKYKVQKSAPEYANFANSTQIYGTYDDHDYGVNDGDKNWPLRDTAAALMLDFLDVPADHPARSRAGGYQTYVLGTANRQVRLILLDTRYFRDALEPATDNPDQRYKRSEAGDILGAAQWAWLENILATDESQVTILVSSVQVLATEHAYEKWSLFPKAKERLLNLLLKYEVRNPLLISGDRHVAEAAVASGHSVGNAELSLVPHSEAEPEHFTLLEITSSGLTHSYEGADEPNVWRVSPLVGQRNFGLLTIDWSDTDDPLLFIQVLSPEREQEFFRIAMQSGKILPDVDQFDYSISMTKVLKPCPESPNCVSTQTSQAAKKMEPLTYTGELANAKKQLREMVEKMARTTLIEESEDYLHFSFTTLPIPFKDDVEFVFDDANKLIHFRSASRVGYSDIGVNARRMKKISRRWQALAAN